jgi:outer membrane protein OmpA-like peptidoglycan-associated protein
MMDLSNILFAFDRFNLTDEAVAELDKVTAWLRENPGLRVEISGHTDNYGADDYNMRLSENRAKAVRDYFTEHGVDASRLSYMGYGESQPVADNTTDDGRRRNRRVELGIVD